MARTPFEVRLDTLILAKDILSENAAVARENLVAMREFIEGGGTIVDLDKKSNNPPELFDTFEFSTDDVLTEAKKLYAFVAPKGDEDSGPSF